MQRMQSPEVLKHADKYDSAREGDKIELGSLLVLTEPPLEDAVPTKSDASRSPDICN
jgi:hypothetical protein